MLIRQHYQEKKFKLNEREIINLDPDIVYLSSEPYPFKEKHSQYFKSILPNAEVKIVDGEMFSWYGSRLLKSFAYFKQLKSNLESI